MVAPAVCLVCNWRGPEDVCPRCGTVLRALPARCGQCGRELAGPLAQCVACQKLEPVGEAPAENVERLTRLPWVDETTAHRLYRHGYTQPADVFKIALPEHAVDLGLHDILARGATHQELRPISMRDEVPCAVCGSARTAGEASCPVCGARGDGGPTSEEIQRQLAHVVGEVRDLEADPDFLGMPREIREEILEAVREEPTHLAALQVVSPTFALQFEEWKSRGINTLSLERVYLEEGEDAFRGKFAPMLRRQITKRREGGRFWCTICNLELDPDADACENCGASFT